MSDQECAFDNWEDAAEEVINNEEPPKQAEEEVKVQEKAITQQNITPEVAKETLKDRIAKIKAINDEDFAKSKFDGLSEANTTHKKISGNQVMKNDKDFEKFANQVVERLARDVGQEPIDENCMGTFVEELTLYLYKGLEWKNFVEINKKLKIAKNQRKTEEKKLAKQQQKRERQKKVEEALEATEATEVNREIADVPAQEDDLFQGAGMNSKQEEEERKKKAMEQAASKKQESKQQTQKPQEEEEDDDDFM